MEKLIANLASSKVRTETLKGKNYLVAPVSMILEGVWPGSAGPILYTEKEIEKSIPAWNHKPITVEHPTNSKGELVSGALTESLEKFSLGIILNAKFNKRTKKLQAEAWFETDRFAQVEGGDRIHAALLANQKLEVSTGLFVDAAEVSGTYNNKQYTMTASNFRPDHLAIILSGEGACSVKDGAGLLVNKAELPAEETSEDSDKSRPEPIPMLIGNAMELTSLLDKVRTAVYQAYEVYRENEPSTYAYIEAIYPSYCIICLQTGGETAHYKQNYATENDSVTLLGELIPVTRKVTYQVNNTKENMERKDLIAKLGQEHSEFVANMSDEQFKAFEKALQPSQAAPAASAAPAEKIVCNSVEELLSHASESVKNIVQDAVGLAVKTREDLIEKIVANSKDVWTKEELASFQTAHLTKLAASIQAPASAKPNPAVYAGEAFVGNQGKVDTSKVAPPLPIPTFSVEA